MCFTNIRGATGPAGTALVALGLAAIADATVVGGADVPFSNNGLLNNISHTAGLTTITVNLAGVYQINYSISITAGIGATIAIAVNGTAADSINVTALISKGNLSGSSQLIIIKLD